MQILRLELENVKSYRQATVEFAEGINFIYGENGAGKSTLVQAVGYALFDASGTGAQARYLLREGEKRGLIICSFLAPDGRVYRSERGIGPGAPWRLFDDESGLQLAEGRKEVIRCLREEVLKTPVDWPLDVLFQEIIGVQQGGFAQPFLETPTNREKTFNRLLRIHSYREAFERSAGVGKLLQERLRGLQERRDGLQATLAALPQVREAIQAAQEELTRRAQELSALRSQLQETDAERKRLERLREELLEAERDWKEAAAQAAQVEGEYRAALRRLEESQEAARICNQTEADYRAHEKAQERYTILQQEQQKRQQQERELAQLLEQRKTLEARIQARQEGWGREEAELHHRREALDRERATLSERLAAVREELAPLEERQAQTKGLAERWERLSADWERLCEQLDDLRQEAVELEEEAAEITRRSEEYDRIPKLEAQVQAAQTLREQQAALAQKIALLDDQIARTKRHREQAQDGLCPILREECRNVGGNLAHYFQRELEVLEARRKALEEQQNQVEWKIGALEALEEELEELLAGRQEMERRKERLKEAHERLEARWQAFPWERWREEIQALRQTATEAEETENDRLFSPKGEQPLSPIVLRSRLDELKELKPSSPQAIEEARRTAGELARSARAAAEQTVALLDRYSQKRDHLRAEEAKAQEALRQTERRIAEAKDRLRSIAQERTELDQQRGALQALREQEDSLRRSLEAYVGLDQALRETEALLVQTRESWKRYLAHQHLAKELPERQEEKERAEATLTRARALEARLQNRYAQTANRWDQQAYVQAQERYETLSQAVVRGEAEEKSLRRELERLQSQLRELQEQERQLIALEEEVRRTERALALGELVRMDILRHVGDRLAVAYRARVSQRATELYRAIAREPVRLEWAEQYELRLRNGESSRTFQQLSGGEQMSAALAVRLALLELFAGIGFAIFDEPTVNLDAERRERLAEAFPVLRDRYDQLWIISHDNTFDALVDRAIRIEKELETGSRCEVG
ncbi:MAG: hypothetical protein KatS3mg115_1064 [Candidatus Poribacteria bacterium]|nr:MAG: hypothetical protein KatS3mg115_1064 [Candidatus Poribacteria bacterium]